MLARWHCCYQYPQLRIGPAHSFACVQWTDMILSEDSEGVNVSWVGETEASGAKEDAKVGVRIWANPFTYCQ